MSNFFSRCALATSRQFLACTKLAQGIDLITKTGLLDFCLFVCLFACVPRLFLDIQLPGPALFNSIERVDD